MKEDDINIRASAEEINTAIGAVVTNDFFKKLIAYSIKRLLFQFQIEYDSDKGFKGHMAEDIVSNLFISFLDDGGRNWNKSKYPDFKKQIYSALDSEISNIVSKNFVKSENIEVESEVYVLDFESLEYNELYNHCIAQLEKSGADIDELLVFECMSKGLLRREIAYELNIPPEGITIIRKRLDRKLNLLRKQLESTWS
jgi:DNA-binding CsgD family transcriptional regulator